MEAKTIEETDVFKIVHYSDGYESWYKWFLLVKGDWQESETTFTDKGQCLLNFIAEKVNFI